MKALGLTLSVFGVLAALPAAPAQAHTLHWRAGESRVVGVGHCAKGPCMRRVYWGDSKFHRHIENRVVFDRIVPVRCLSHRSRASC